MSSHIKAHAYAIQNGYNGSLADYIKLQYAGYMATCQRCGILPMTFIQFCKGE